MTDLPLSNYLKSPIMVVEAGKNDAAVKKVRYHYEEHKTVIKGLTCNSKKEVHYKHLYSIIANIRRYYLTKEYIVGIAWDDTPLKDIALIINKARNYFAPRSKMNRDFFYDTVFSDLGHNPGLDLVDCVKDGDRYIFLKFK